MTIAVTNFAIKLVGVNYEIGWDAQDPMESDENFDAPWEGDYYFWGAVKDGEMQLPNRSSQLPPNSPYTREMQQQYNEGYAMGRHFYQVFNQN